MDNKKVIVLTTGGTIAMKLDPAHGIVPAVSGEDLVASVPGLREACPIEVMEFSNIPSPHMTPKRMFELGNKVEELLRHEDILGVVITHGTDTLAYTAALLTHLLPHFDKPLVLTGSMLPMGVPDSDAPRNLLDAFRTAADGRAGVYAVMNGQILHGSHVFKQHSTEIDAFLSANAAPAGEIRESEVHWNTPAPVPSGEPKLIEQIDTHILPVRLTPDLDPSFFSVLLGYPKVVLQAFGAGGVPARLESAVRDLIQSGTRVYITTQCPEGGVHLHKYEVGRRAEALGAISLGSRTFEDALGALMCGEL